MSRMGYIVFSLLREKVVSSLILCVWGGGLTIGNCKKDNVIFETRSCSIFHNHIAMNITKEDLLVCQSKKIERSSQLFSLRVGGLTFCCPFKHCGSISPRVYH